MGKGLGSYIGDYNRIYKKRKTGIYQDDILSTIKRLEGYKEYQDQIKKEKYYAKVRKKKAFERKVRKKFLRKIYSYKPIVNPYIAHYQRNAERLDPNLVKKYTEQNIFLLYEFRHLTLPRTNYKVTAGQALGALRKTWLGFHINKTKGNDMITRYYAEGTQKWNYLLEVPYIPDFSDLGLPDLGYKVDSLEFSD